MKKKSVISAFLAAALIFGSVAVPADSSIPVPSFAIQASAEEIVIPAPTGLKATAGNKKVTLSWNAVKNADTYYVYQYNSKTKKYKKIKSTKNTKTTISELTNGTTYKFKVAAVFALPDKNKVGKLSAEASAKPTSSSKSNSSSKLSVVELTKKDMVGTWVYYDFSEKISYTNGGKYNVNQDKYGYNPYMTQISVIDPDNVLILFDDDQTGENTSIDYCKIISNNRFVNASGSIKLDFKTYEYNGDYYMFIKWKTNYSYIYKFVPAPEKEEVAVKKAASLDGKWKAVDFAETLTIAKCSKYNPGYKLWPFELYMNNIQIKNGKANVYFNDGTSENNVKINTTTQKLGNCKFKIYNIDGEKYMFLEWANSYGDFFYILKKS